MILPAAFIALITCAVASHWAVWRRLEECEAKLREFETRVDSQAKQIAGLQTWCRNIDRREDELRSPRIRPQPGIVATGEPTRLQRAAEEALRLWPADPATYVARTYPKGPNEL